MLDRVGELAVLTAHAQGTTIVVGPPGIGKTALLAVGTATAAASGALVLAATATPLERDLGWGLARQLLERDLPGAVRQLGAAESVPLHDLTRAVLGLADCRAVLVCVDDVQWTDRPTLRWLAHLHRRIDGHRVALLLGLRTGEPDSDGEALAALRESAQVLTPGPLSATAVTTLVQDRLGPDIVPELTAACLRASGGNPFLLGELVRELHGQGLPPDASTAALIDGLDVETVRRTVVLRLARLPAAALNLARAVAVLEPHAGPRIAAALADLTPMEAAQQAARLVAAAVLADGPAYRFVHPLVRAAVLGDLGSHVVAELHGRAAVLLQAAGQADEAAMHALESSPAGDPAVVDLLVGAARRALQLGAPETAVRCLERAVLEPPSVTDRWELLVELGSTAAGVDATVAARALHAAVAEATGVADRVRALGATLAAATLTGELGPARSAVDELAVLDALTPALLAEAVRLERTWSTGRADYERAVARLAGCDEAWVGCLVDANSAYLRVLHQDDAAAAAHIAQDLLERTLPAEALQADPGLPNSMAWVLYFSGGYQDAEAALRSQVAAAQSGARGAIGRSVLARVLVATGRLAEAQRHAEEALELAWAHGQPGVVALAHAALLEVACDRHVDLPAAVPRTSGRMHDALLLEQARVALRTGDPGTAATLAVTAGDGFTSRGDGAAGLDWLAVAAEAHTRAGDRSSGLVFAERAVAAGQDWGAGRSTGMALRARALCGPDPAAGLQIALDRLEAGGATLDAARCRADLGAALRRAGSRKEARELLEEAFSYAAGAGADRLAATIRQELVATGARPRRAARSGPSSLTAAERRVAELAAAGRTNKQIAAELFVGLRTVELHLSHCYAKLDIASRTELGPSLEG